MLQRAIFLWSFLLIVQKKADNFLRIESQLQTAIVSKSFWTRMRRHKDSFSLSNYKSKGIPAK